jgi:hypothetical protein
VPAAACSILVVVAAALMQISIKEAPVNKLKEVKAYYRGNVLVRTRLISLGEGGSAPLVLIFRF